MAATRPRYCGVLLVAALWLTAGLVCPGQLAAQKTKRPPPPPPFAALFPLEEAWMITLPARPSASAAHDGSRVYVPIASGMLVALDLERGETLWSIPFKATAAPVIGDGVLYGAAADTVYAIDPGTGATRWMAKAGTMLLLQPAGTRLFAVGAGIVRAFDTQAGQLVWTRTLPDSGNPVGSSVDPEVVVATFSDGPVIALSRDDGRELWTRRLEGRPSPPLAFDESVFVGSTNNRFYALNARSGKERWNWRTGGDILGAAADTKAVYYTSLDAVVRAVNPGNGHQRWKREGGTRAVAPPLILDGSLLVTGLSPTLSAFNPLTGVPLGTFELPGETGEISGTPLVAGMLVPRTVSVAVVLKDGRVFGLRSLPLMFNENAPQPLLALPGKPLTRERLP